LLLKEEIKRLISGWRSNTMGQREIIITKTFNFGAAHNLTSYHGKCEELHGHNYKLDVSIKGIPDKEGMVIDYKKIKAVVEEHVIDKLDHTYLNDVLGFSPTSENILLWVEEQIKNKLSSDNYNLYRLELWETENNKATIYVN